MGITDRVRRAQDAEVAQRDKVRTERARGKAHRQALSGDAETYEADTARAVDYLRRASGNMRVNQLDTEKLLAFGTLEALLAIHGELARVREHLERLN